MTTYLATTILILGLLGTLPVCAGELDVKVKMSENEASTYYVPVAFEGSRNHQFMVDTGSSYVVINKDTLHTLKRTGKASYIKELAAVMANGTEEPVSVYKISRLLIGCCCPIRDVEVAVFPNSKRQILGLSALKKVAPFALSVAPANLLLSHCDAPASPGAAAQPGMLSGNTKADDESA